MSLSATVKPGGNDFQPRDSGIFMGEGPASPPDIPSFRYLNNVTTGTGHKMADVIHIIIINRLVKEKRYLTIYHHGTGSSHLVSDKKEIAVPLNLKTKKDYLTISVVGEPGHMWHGCNVSLPYWLDFDFLTTDAVTLSHSGGGENFVIEVPPGLPNWQLKITRQKDSRPSNITGSEENPLQRIIISDDREP